MATYKYIDSICGGGKTNAAIDHMIAGVRRGKKFVLLQPRIQLIEQTAANFAKKGYSGHLEVIHGKNGSEPVTKRIHAFLDSSDASGVLITTIQAWEGIERRKMGDWHLIVDECPTIFTVTKVQSRRLKDELLQHLEFHEDADGYTRVRIKEGHKQKLKLLEVEARNEDSLKPLAKTVMSLNRHNKTWVKTDFYTKFIEDYAKSLTFYHVMSPSIFDGFKSVVIMGANFTHSEVYLMWRHLGIHFKRINGLAGKEFPSSHPKQVGEKLDIYYLSEDWSKHQKNNHTSIYGTEYRRAVTEIFGGERFIHTYNEGDNPHLLESISGGKYVSPKAHGNNEFREYNNAAIFGHFNLSNDQVSFLINKFKLSAKIVWDMRNIDIYYQFICRISLREMPSAGSEVADMKIILMDKDMAYLIQSKVEGSRVHKFQSDLIGSIDMPKKGRKSIGSTPASGAERTRKSRNKHELVETTRKLQILSGTYWSDNEIIIPGSCNERILIRSSDDKNKMCVGGWSVSILGKKNSITFESKPINGFEGLVSFLEEKSERHITSKHSNELFNVTTFIPQTSFFKRRRITEVLYSNAILMDMDSENNCDQEEFSKFFSGIEMIIYSSFQSSPERRRWRVIVNLSRAVSEKEYNIIAKDLLAICKNNGFEFDDKKRATDFMYLPGQGLNKNGFFFEHFYNEGRVGLNVDAWISDKKTSLIVACDGVPCANDNMTIEAAIIKMNSK
jgi:Type III restriction enzyme, res subunit